ncbi:hypothetical protein ACCO45_001059 [Purpureocillium lilacinum]|uniref:Uncharacterized protein n=1 Tax=Purpureocillium lilacinum TaxID=33203 RepID=A0ACC4E8P3_PURLI
MATATTLSVPDQIRQLDDARKLVLGDVKYYPSVSFDDGAPTSLAEAFSTPALPNGEKETMQPYVLTTLESLLESDRQDWLVLRSVIQAAASIYPLAMRWIINNGYDTVTWERMLVIKQRILRIWDTAPPSVRISCIKFAQRVVLAQTVASNAEFRYGGALDVSLDKVPLNHQSLDPRNLEAEATGLLDRMLSVLQESSDALIVDATLNCLSILVRTRPATSGRILNAMLNFNPLQAATSPMTPKNKVMVKSMEKTARMLLLHLTKRDPHNPMAPRIQQHLERMVRSVTELFDETSKKRPLEAPQHDGLDAKRQRVVGSHAPIPPLGPGPHSLGDVFTLITNDELKGFDISQLPVGLVAKVSVTALAGLEPELLSKAVDAVRRRLHDLATAPAPELNPNTAPLGVDDDDDDYEPDFYQAEDTEQILNKLDGASSATEPMALDGSLALTSFSLPQPPSLPAETALSAGSGTVARVLEMMKSLDEPAVKKDKAGYNRLAASSGTRDSWMSILSRLATRASAGLEDVSVKGEDDDTKRPEGLSDDIRELLYNYVMEDFRKHIDVAVSWLCEEWYNDKTQMKRGTTISRDTRNARCGSLTDFFPTCTRRTSVTQLALTSLLYLVIMRPPVKESALDTVQDIWTEFEDARPMAGKYLAKYRPGFLEAANNSKAEGDGAAPAAIAT